MNEPVVIPLDQEIIPGPAWRAAEEYGIDMAALRYRMSLTPMERLERHEQALALVRALRQAGKDYYGYDPRHPE